MMPLRDEQAEPRAAERGFTTTHWSVVLAAGRSVSPQASEALEKLCRTYWYPLYAYARREGHTVHDAQDLTQEFFARFLAKDYLNQVEREKGRFRSFLLASLKHFLANERDRSNTLKRGGGCAFISWDDVEREGRVEVQAPQEPSPIEPAYAPQSGFGVTGKRPPRAITERAINTSDVEALVPPPLVAPSLAIATLTIDSIALEELETPARIAIASLATPEGEGP